ncbi:MAG: hypothetical protein ABFD82_13600 [Syntrophaceae bacterium]
MKTYKIPVIWEMYGIVEIEADSLKAACEKVNYDSDETFIPKNGEFIEGSLKVDDNKAFIRSLNKRQAAG